MKAYLVQINNGELYEDYYDWIDAVYTTYRGATQYLMNMDYKMYPVQAYGEGEWDLRFYRPESDEYRAEGRFGKILEMDIIE